MESRKRKTDWSEAWGENTEEERKENNEIYFINYIAVTMGRMHTQESFYILFKIALAIWKKATHSFDICSFHMYPDYVFAIMIMILQFILTIAFPCIVFRILIAVKLVVLLRDTFSQK